MSRRSAKSPADASSRLPLVEYDEVADRYDRGRAMTGGSMERWRAAVGHRLPEGPLGRVLDVGAGTGLFLAMWASLGAEEIVAVEPSAAMRSRAVSRMGAGTHSVAGTAGELPLVSRSGHVAWLSAVVHHIGDLDAAAVELRRVLRPGGRVLVRGFFPDTSHVPWLDHLPRSDRAMRRFPTAAALAQVFEGAGFVTHDVTNVTEPHRHSAGEAADWIERMRAADSLLTGFGDDEVDAATASLRRDPDATLDPAVLSLLTVVAV
jgi:SAM-dependent methyltransferase